MFSKFNPHLKKNFIKNFYLSLLGRYSDAVLIFFCLTIILYAGISIFKIISTSAPDFPSYYYATLDLLQHKNPYTDKNIPNIFIYPTATSIFYIPFVVLPYIFAQGLFVILSALAVPIIVYLSLKLVYKRFFWRELLLFSSLVYLSFPTKFTLGMGQVNILAYLFLILGFFLYKKEKIFSSSVFIGIAFLVKPILSFMLLFFVLNRSWKALFFIIITLFVLVIVSFIIYDINFEIYYVTSIVPSLISGTEGREVYYNQGIMGFISRLTENGFIRTYLSFVLSFILLVITIYMIHSKKMDTNTKFALVLTLLPIVHTLSWQHYFVILIFPYILVTKKNYR